MYIIYIYHKFISHIFLNIVVQTPILAQKGHITTDRRKCCTLHQLGVNYLKFPFLSYFFMYPYCLNITLTLNTLFISFTPFLSVLLTHLHTKIYLLNEEVHNSHLAILRTYSFVHKCNICSLFFIHPLAFFC